MEQILRTSISHLCQTRQIRLLIWSSKSSNKASFVNSKWCNSNNRLHQRTPLPSIKIFINSSNLTTQRMLQQRCTNSKEWSKRRQLWTGTKLPQTSGRIWAPCSLLRCHSKTLSKTTINSTNKGPLSVSPLEQLATTNTGVWVSTCSTALTLTVHQSFQKYRWRPKTCLSTQSTTLSFKKSSLLFNIKTRGSLAGSAVAQIKIRKGSTPSPPLIRWLRTVGCNSKTLYKIWLIMVVVKAAPTPTRTAESVAASRYPPTAASQRKESAGRQTR